MDAQVDEIGVDHGISAWVMASVWTGEPSPTSASGNPPGEKGSPHRPSARSLPDEGGRRRARFGFVWGCPTTASISRRSADNARGL